MIDDSVPDGLADIRECWSFSDLYDAHLAIDALAEMKPREGEKPSSPHPRTKRPRSNFGRGRKGGRKYGRR